MRDEILDILRDLQPDLDAGAYTDLIDGRHLDSLTIIALVAELEEAFDITIPTVEIVADNFNSVDQMCAMVTRLDAEA